MNEADERQMTESKQSAEMASVVRERDRLAALINSISDEIWFADREARFTLVNPPGAQAFTLDQSHPTDIKELAVTLEVFRADGSPRPIEEAPPLRALRGEVVRNVQEIIRIPATGELRNREVSSSPVRDARGVIVGSVSIVRDITAQKQAEEQLRQRTQELAQSNAELASFNKLMVGRELRMIELKQEIDQLCRQFGQPTRYGSESD
ncbi:MAG: PAS domain S-box protein [Candidatus Marinimicrobia bacterium]|nr:PAS domain S-box protein [Candidatus Neomarinimicrobiota bacterium]